jgi:alkyl hydroperoxide reductase subunit AhpC
MKTRSQTKINEKCQLYEVNIDFDEASREWHKNKKSTGNGSYKYICVADKNNTICGAKCYKDLSYCWQHRNFANK